MKESRLFKIIYTLLQKDRVTAPELAKKFEVSVRTIYRDIDVISSADIPIYVTAGRNEQKWRCWNRPLYAPFYAEKFRKYMKKINLDERCQDLQCMIIT